MWTPLVCVNYSCFLPSLVRGARRAAAVAGAAAASVGPSPLPMRRQRSDPGTALPLPPCTIACRKMHDEHDVLYVYVVLRAISLTFAEVYITIVHRKETFSTPSGHSKRER